MNREDKAMKWNPRTLLTLALGAALGAALCGPASAAVEAITATASVNTIYVDGRQVRMDAYKINGCNYVKLRDIGQTVGFNVYWDDGVQIDSDTDYTGVAPNVPSAAVNAAETVASSAAMTVDVEAARNEIIQLTNELRQENGAAALEKDDLLMQAAQVRAEEMAATTTYAHTRPDGSRYTTVTDCPYVAENINRISQLYLEQQSKKLADAAVDSWAHSEGHLKNMLNAQAASIGVGIARGVGSTGKDAWYCVQEFLYNGCTVTTVNVLQK